MVQWKNTKTLVTGGASFIGSHLVDSLVRLGSDVTIVDDLSSGRYENIAAHIRGKKARFIKADLLDGRSADKCTRGMDLVFHLAAAHGGRGYVELHQAECAGNMVMDGYLFRACKKNKVKKIVFASSGCVYPNFKQMDTRKKIYLKEDMAGPPYDADNMYGWAKLMAEKTLKVYYEEYGMKSVSLRYFTVYGPRGLENHAVMALIAKVFVKQDPIEIWGDGSQIRNWTFVDDIVRGTILAAEHIDDARAINLGTTERIRVFDMIDMIFKRLSYRARIVARPDMPTGPLNRVASNEMAKQLLGWEPKVMFKEGLNRTIDWYLGNKKPADVKRILANKLTER